MAAARGGDARPGTRTAPPGRGSSKSRSRGGRHSALERGVRINSIVCTMSTTKISILNNKVSQILIVTDILVHTYSGHLVHVYCVNVYMHIPSTVYILYIVYIIYIVHYNIHSTLYNTIAPYLVRLCEEYVVEVPGSRLDAALGFLGGGHRQARTLREVFQQHHVVKGQAGDISMVSSIVWYIV